MKYTVVIYLALNKCVWKSPIITYLKMWYYLWLISNHFVTSTSKKTLTNKCDSTIRSNANEALCRKVMFLLTERLPRCFKIFPWCFTLETTVCNTTKWIWQTSLGFYIRLSSYLDPLQTATSHVPNLSNYATMERHWFSIIRLVIWILSMSRFAKSAPILPQTRE